MPRSLPFNTHEMSAVDAVAEIADLDADAEVYEALHAHERNHPDFEGGRKTVLNALEERLGEEGLGAGASEGLARAPSAPVVEGGVQERAGAHQEVASGSPVTPGAGGYPGVPSAGVNEASARSTAPDPDMSGPTVLVRAHDGQVHEAVLAEELDGVRVGRVVLKDGRGTTLVLPFDEAGTLRGSWREVQEPADD